MLDTFGITGDARIYQEDRINGLLDGEAGKPGKRKIAARERAEANKLRGGQPLPENSIESLTEEDIQYLIREAREQVKIAQVEHDGRLRRSIIDLTRRACSRAGSVSQADLDALPGPHHSEFAYDRDPQRPDVRIAPVAGDCGEIYEYLQSRAGRRDGAGPNAEMLRQLATPTPPSQLPAELNPTSPALPEFPRFPQAKIPFNTALPRLRNFAASACNAPISVSVDKELMSPSLPYGFSSRDAEDSAALEAGLDPCSVKLFRRLIQVIRSGEGNLISSEWVREEVERFSPPDSRGPGRASPPRDREDRGGPPPDPDHDRVWDRIGLPKPKKG